MEYQESRIYLDIDSVFDIRLAVIAQLDPEVASTLLKEGAYWQRESDHWDKLTQGQITQEAYQQQYAKRDNTTLQRAYITGIFAPLAKVLADNELARSSGGLNKEIAFEVNLYPYTFDDIEQAQFIQLFKYRLGMDCKVTMVSVPPSLLTVKYLTDHYAAAFMYDFMGWIKLHLADLIKVKHPDFNLVAPKLFEKDVSRLSMDEKQDEIKSFRLYMLEYMDLSFIDVSCFSVFRPQ